jgi:hypothetical protein
LANRRRFKRRNIKWAIIYSDNNLETTIYLCHLNPLPGTES